MEIYNQEVESQIVINAMKNVNQGIVMKMVKREILL